jgi:hypothetical protein
MRRRWFELGLQSRRATQLQAHHFLSIFHDKCRAGAGEEEWRRRELERHRPPSREREKEGRKEGAAEAGAERQEREEEIMERVDVRLTSGLHVS